MKAYSLQGIGDLVYKEVSYPECPSGWCVVKVKTAGICSSDIPRIYEKGTYHFPTIPGHEFSGIVDSVGDVENNDWIGKRVGVFPLIPCKQCNECKNRNYEMCSNYDYVGSRRDGAFAEYVAVPVWNLIELSDNITFEEAAMMEPLAVALHAMKQSNIKKGDTVAIVGTGMIAFAAGQWAKKMGAENVSILGRSEQKRKLVESIPDINYFIDTCNSMEFDVVLEAVGSGESIIHAINIVKPGGTLILMGNPNGDVNLPQNVYWRILRKQLHISGTWNSKYENKNKSDWTEVKDSLQNKSVEVTSLISHFFSQANLIEGLKLMYEHKEPYCKVMTIWNSGENDEQ